MIEIDLELCIANDLLDLGAGEDMNGQAKKNGVIGESVRDLLAEAALAKAMTSQQRNGFVSGSAGAVVVLVPSMQWVADIADAIEVLNDNIRTLRKVDAKKREDDPSASISRTLGEGRTVAVITPSSQYLPDLLKTVRDETIAVGSPTPDLVAKVIRKVSSTGRIPKSFAKANTGVLDFDELTSLIVSDGNAEVAANRIARAAEAKTDKSRPSELLPDIEVASEFGEARLWAMELKQDLADIRAGKISASMADRGAVLYGPPGTGKTLLARSLGSYLGIPVILESMGNFFASGPGYLDSVLKAQRAAFERARAAAPSILFLDEIDALQTDLDALSERGRDWWAPIVTDFLTLLDGATSDREGVIVIGATNRIHAIGANILRPNRLERKIFLGPPNAEGVVRVLRHHLAGDLEDVDLTPLSKFCAGRGITPAVLMEAVRHAKRLSRRAGRAMLLSDLEARLMPESDLSPADRTRIAVHEAGHAVMGTLLIPDQLETVSMHPAAEGEGGHTLFRSPTDRIETALSYERRIQITLAGRAAEILVLGSPSSGAGGTEDSDLAQATMLIAAANLSLGLGATPRWRCTPGMATSALSLDREARTEVEIELARIADRTLEILVPYTEAIRMVSETLGEQGQLSGADVRQIVSQATSLVVAQTASASGRSAA